MKDAVKLGLSQLMNSSPLGMAAVSACQAMVEVEEPQLDQVHADFRLAAISMGYLGVEMGVAYYRHTWSLDAPNEEIARHVLEYFDRNAEEELWEDWGFGLTRGTFPERPTDFGHGLVFGVGYTDGNAVVTNRINEARRRAGLQPLELNHRLRNLAREYLALHSEPSPDQIRRDIEGPRLPQARCHRSMGVQRCLRSDPNRKWRPLCPGRGPPGS